MKKSLAEELFLRPYNFEFTQAVRLLQNACPQSMPLGTGTDPLKEAISFKARIFLSAPPSDLYRIKAPFPLSLEGPVHPKESTSLKTSGGDSHWYTPPNLPLLCYQGVQNSPQASLKKRSLFDQGPLEISVNFLGIAGAQGPLPIVYTEMVLQRLKVKDPVLRDFLDLFNHRYISLSYRISEKLNPTLQRGTPEETPLGKILTRLTGIATDQDMAFPIRSILSYTRFFWKKPHTPNILKQILQNYFGQHVTIQLFQGGWISLDAYKKTILGKSTSQNNLLGKTAVVGSRVWCQDQSFNVCLTIKTPEEYLQFLPQGPAHLELRQFLNAYVSPRFFVKIALKLIRKPPSCLANPGRRFPFILGWTSWLLRDTSFEDAPWVTVR